MPASPSAPSAPSPPSPRAPRCASSPREATGAADYWYAKTSSPIKKLTDLTDKNTIAFSTRGSSTDSIVRAFIDEYKLKVKPMTTGNPSSTLTAVMTDQVDVGWASPPFGLKEIDEGKTRVVARATDSALVRGQTIRVVVANADALTKRKDVFDRFMKAYRATRSPTCTATTRRSSKTMPSSTASPKRWRGACATSSFPARSSSPTKSTVWNSMLAEAVTLKFIPAPLSKEQVTELVKISEVH